MHRTLPDDSELVRAIAVLARAAQDAIWRPSKATQELRSLLREYYPRFLAAFVRGSVTNLASPEARAVLALAPTPAAGARLSKARIAAALRRAGRQRGIDALAAQIQQALRVEQLRQPELVENAMGRQASALLATLTAECVNADELGQAAIEAFRQHRAYEIITSFPGLGEPTGARVLAEIGDDRSRFADARGLKAFAGAAPVTRASGRSISITRRMVKNNRLAAVGFVWAFAAIPHPGSQPRITTSAAELTATVMPPRYATCSTECSDNSITACNPAKPTTWPRRFHKHPHWQNRPPLNN